MDVSTIVEGGNEFALELYQQLRSEEGNLFFSPSRTFISTIQFTDEGMKDIKSTSKKAEAFKATAETMGIAVKHIFWMLGRFDGLAVFGSPDEETDTALMLQLASYGNVHTETTRAYEASEMEQILSKLSG